MSAMDVAELGTLTAAEIIDARGAACPGPLLEAKKGMGKVAIGDVIEVWSSDPVTKTDISAWAGKVGLGVGVGPGVGLGIGDGCPARDPPGVGPGLGFQVAPGVGPAVGIEVADGSSVSDGRLAT